MLNILGNDIVLWWKVEELQLTASSVPTLGQSELQDQPIIRSKISAALNTLKFAPNTLEIKFKYSAIQQLCALK